MSDISDIETKVRYLINDVSTSMIPGDIFTYTTSSVFTLTESNVITVSSVLKNDVAQASNTYSYSSTTNKVTVTFSLTSGDTVEIQYTYYPNYSTTEINGYAEAALVHLSACNYKTWLVRSSELYPDPSFEEENLIALIASLLLEPDNISFRMSDFSKLVPKDVPTIDKIRHVIAHAKKNTSGIFEVL